MSEETTTYFGANEYCEEFCFDPPPNTENVDETYVTVGYVTGTDRAYNNDDIRLFIVVL